MIVLHGLPVPAADAGFPAAAAGPKSDSGQADLSALFALMLQRAGHEIPASAGVKTIAWNSAQAPDDLSADLPTATGPLARPLLAEFVPPLGESFKSGLPLGSPLFETTPDDPPEVSGSFRVLRLRVDEQALTRLARAGDPGLDLEVPVELDLPRGPEPVERIVIPGRPAPVKDMSLEAAKGARIAERFEPAIRPGVHTLWEHPSLSSKPGEALFQNADLRSWSAAGSYTASEQVLGTPVLRALSAPAGSERVEAGWRDRADRSLDTSTASRRAGVRAPEADSRVSPARSGVLPLEFANFKAVRAKTDAGQTRQAPPLHSVPEPAKVDASPAPPAPIASGTSQVALLEGQTVAPQPTTEAGGSPSLSFTVHGWRPDRPVTNVRITLEPAELGELQIHLRHQNGRVFARIIATRPEALPHVRAQFALLKEALAEKGVEFGAFSLTAQSAFSAAGLARPVPGGTAARRAFAETEESTPADETKSDEERGV